MAIPAINVLGNPNVTEGNFQIAIEDLRKSVIGSGKAYDSANTYSQYDTCVYNGVVYYSKINSNTGNTPAVGTNWGLIGDLITGVVHNVGNESIGGIKTFSSGIKIQNQNVSPFNGFKNYIINGKKIINQRALLNTDNSYNQDRWYKVGNNWYQGIEGDNNLISGKTYTLSWTGVATASYYVGTATSSTINAQSFTTIENGGNFTLTISAGQNLWIKFASDSTGSTFNFVQLEEGSVATPFENRPYGLELALCQRYYESCNVFGSNYSNNASGTNFRFTQVQYKVVKRVIPSVVVSNQLYNNCNNLNIEDSYTSSIGINATCLGVGTMWVSAILTASAEL